MPLRGGHHRLSRWAPIRSVVAAIVISVLMVSAYLSVLLVPRNFTARRTVIVGHDGIYVEHEGKLYHISAKELLALDTGND